MINDQVGKQKIYQLKDNIFFSYKIKFSFIENKLVMEIDQENSFPKIQYLSTFILQEIQKYDKWFRLFDSFEEAFESINDLF